MAEKLKVGDNINVINNCSSSHAGDSGIVVGFGKGKYPDVVRIRINGLKTIYSFPNKWLEKIPEESDKVREKLLQESKTARTVASIDRKPAKEEAEKSDKERKIIRVLHTFDNGVSEYIEDEDLKLWGEAMDTALMLSYTHHNNVQEKLKKIKWKEVIL